MSPRRAGDLSPLLLLVIDALEAQDTRARQRERKALRAFGELARVQIPARGVFAPTENELYQAIDAIAARHFGYATAAKRRFASSLPMWRRSPPATRLQRRRITCGRSRTLRTSTRDLRSA